MKCLTKEQAAIITLYTGITCCNFTHAHRYAEKILARPVMTHEFANTEFVETLKNKVKPFFLDLVPED